MTQNLSGPQHGKNNSATFSPTADQRYLLGTDVFLRTHFPMKLLERQDSNLSLTID